MKENPQFALQTVWRLSEHSERPVRIAWAPERFARTVWKENRSLQIINCTHWSAHWSAFITGRKAKDLQSRNALVNLSAMIRFRIVQVAKCELHWDSIKRSHRNYHRRLASFDWRSGQRDRNVDIQSLIRKVEPVAFEIEHFDLLLRECHQRDSAASLVTQWLRLLSLENFSWQRENMAT